MTVSPVVLWFVLALVAAGVEMMLGSVYLLAVVAGAAAAGIAAWLDLALSWQLVVCAAVTALCAVVIMMRGKPQNDPADRLMALDEGKLVTVTDVADDGSAVVQYRGAPWTARSETGPLTPGTWLISRVDGPQLILAPVQKTSS